MLREPLGTAVDRTPGAQPRGEQLHRCLDVDEEVGTRAAGKDRQHPCGPPLRGAQRERPQGLRRTLLHQLDAAVRPGPGEDPLDREPLDGPRDAVAHGGRARSRVPLATASTPRRGWRATSRPAQATRRAALAAGRGRRDMPASAIVHGIPRATSAAACGVPGSSCPSQADRRTRPRPAERTADVQSRSQMAARMPASTCSGRRVASSTTAGVVDQSVSNTSAFRVRT